jgi:hypothetical protein
VAGWATGSAAATSSWSPAAAASNGGVDAEPQWWLDRCASPDGEVEVRGRRWAVTAAEVGDGDHARLWAAVTARFDGYRARVSRRIALVRPPSARD